MKTILVPAGGGASDQVVFETAMAVAQPLGAHLEFLHVHLDASEAALYTPHVAFARGTALRNALAELTDQCETRARTARENVRAFCEQLRVGMVNSPRASTRVTASWRTEEEGDALKRLVHNARHNDLVVVGRATRSDGLPQTRLEALLMESGRPLLIASSARPTSLLRTVMVCWRDTADAARAVSAAMPILAKAERVVVVSVSETDDSTAGAVSGIIRELQWHGIAAGSRVCARDGVSTARRLAIVAEECGASLLVIGGYGHGRTREQLFGGCTQAVLESANLPVFLLH
jgi:nucleotide-binding universal stress UspA family protein